MLFLDFAKIQFLKAIHNLPSSACAVLTVFRFCKNTIFESNSQLSRSVPLFSVCF